MSVNRFLSFGDDNDGDSSTVIQRTEPINLTPYVLKSELNPFEGTLQVGDLKTDTIVSLNDTLANLLDGKLKVVIV